MRNAILVPKDNYKKMREIVHAVALKIECPDCGAKAGKMCKPEYGCDELDRALEALQS
jgi:hypothetical protein